VEKIDIAQMCILKVRMTLIYLNMTLQTYITAFSHNDITADSCTLVQRV